MPREVAMIGCLSLDGFENTPSLQVLVVSVCKCIVFFRHMAGPMGIKCRKGCYFSQNWMGLTMRPHMIWHVWHVPIFPGKPIGQVTEACCRIFEECRSKKSLPSVTSVDEEVQWRTNCKKRLAKALKDDGMMALSLIPPLKMP